LQPSFTSLWVFLSLMTTLMLFIGVKERIPLQEFFTDLVPIFGTLMLLIDIVLLHVASNGSSENI
jgi:hypothetical protein